MLVSLWLLLTFAAQLPYGTGRTTSTSSFPIPTTTAPTPTHTLPYSVMEGSGQDPDYWIWPDDDDDDYNGDDDDYNYDDDDVVDFDDDDAYDDDDDDEDYDNEFYDGLHRGFDDIIYDTNIIHTAEDESKTNTLCFHCLGDGMTGCNVTDMLSDLDRYTVMCVGKCLNISTGPISVYDCAKDLATKDNMCLDDFDTRMCFCEGILCNRPANISLDIDAHSLNTDINLSNEIPLISDDSKRKTVVSNSIPPREKDTRIKTDSSSQTAADKHGFDVSNHFVSETEIDIIIPVKKVKVETGASNLSSGTKDGSVNFSSDDIHSLSVAPLRDGDSGCNSIVPCYGFLFVFSSCLHFLIALVLSS